MPSPCLAAPASTFAWPRPAYPGRRKGDPGYSNPLLAHRLLPSYLKPYVNISLHTREADVVLTIAEHPPFWGHVLLQTLELA